MPRTIDTWKSFEYGSRTEAAFASFSWLEPGGVVVHWFPLRVSVRSGSLRFRHHDSIDRRRRAMTIIGVAMYGSGARRDGDADSDVDLVAVTADTEGTVSIPNTLTISSYPLGQLVCRASLGDLFALHIVSEAKVLYEIWPVFDRIRSAFKYRASYDREIQLASDVGWCLVRYHDRLRDSLRLNARVAWCTRTVLIATAANQQRPIFSARGLAEFASSSDVVALIENKDNADPAPEMVDRFQAFLRRFGSPALPSEWTLEELKARFDADRNLLGQRLVRLVEAA